MQSAEAAARLRLLAKQMTVVADRLAGEATTAALDEAFVETERRLAETPVDAMVDVDAELDLLERTIGDWRRGLAAIAWDVHAREDAGDLAAAWADRLQWVAGLLEATDG